MATNGTESASNGLITFLRNLTEQVMEKAGLGSARLSHHDLPATTVTTTGERHGYTADATLVNTGLEPVRFTGAAADGFMTGPGSMSGVAPTGADANGFMNDQSMASTGRKGFTLDPNLAAASMTAAAMVGGAGGLAGMAGVISLVQSNPELRTQLAMTKQRMGGANVVMGEGSTPNGIVPTGGMGASVPENKAPEPTVASPSK